MKLNKIEKLKANLKPIEYLKHLESLDFNNLSESDRFYLKNFGIYNQSQRANEFMLRVRIAAGRIAIADLENIVNIAKEFNSKLLITARAQIELQKLNSNNILAAYKRLQEANISTWQTLSDNFRNIVTTVYDGLSKDSFIETYPYILQMQKLFFKKAEFLGMIPRKFNTAIVGCSKVSDSFFSNDCLFALAKKDEIFGFNLYLGGKNSELAKDMNIFVKKEQVVELYNAIINAYLKYGNRASRTKARLFYLLESMGLDKFKALLQDSCSFKFESAGSLMLQKEPSYEFKLLKNKSYSYRFNSNFGEVDINSLQNLISFAKDNNLEIRFGIDQNIYLFGLKEPKSPFKSLAPNQNILVCAGSRYCFFSLFDTKEEAAKLNLEKINKYNIKVGYSGCLKGCGRHYFSDIGFVGIRTKVYGKLEFGVRLFLGGLYSQGQMGARLIYWAVPLRALNKILSVIIDEFEQSGYSDFEEFSKEILAKYDSEFLAFWFLAKLYTKQNVSLKDSKYFNYLINGPDALIQSLKENQNILYETIKELERRVYSV